MTSLLDNEVIFLLTLIGRDFLEKARTHDQA